MGSHPEIPDPSAEIWSQFQEGAETPTGSRPPPGRGCRGSAPGPIPNFTKGKIRTKKQCRLSVFLFPTLKSIASTLEASAALADTVALKLRERVIKRRARKLLIYAAIRAIDKRGEKGRLFP